MYRTETGGHSPGHRDTPTEIAITTHHRPPKVWEQWTRWGLLQGDTTPQVQYPSVGGWACSQHGGVHGSRLVASPSLATGPSPGLRHELPTAHADTHDADRQTWPLPPEGPAGPWTPHSTSWPTGAGFSGPRSSAVRVPQRPAPSAGCSPWSHTC